MAIDFFAPMDSQNQLIGQGIDDRNTHAVQAAGNFIGAAVEFSAGMQHRHDDLCRRASFLRVNIDGNTAAIIHHRHRTLCMDDYADFAAITRQRFVYRVIHHFKDHVV